MHVAHRQARGGRDGIVGNDQAVMILVAVFEALQDFNRLVHRRFVHFHGLETAVQGGILFNVPLVFVERGGPYHLELSAGQGRLENVGGVHGAAARAGAHQHMHLVHEQDGLGARQLLDHFLEPVFELAPVHGAGDQAAHVQHHDALVEQRLRHVALHDALGQAFHDGGLADAGFADQGRVVFGASVENLDDPLDFHGAADDGIQLALAGRRRQIEAQLIRQRSLAVLVSGLAAALRRLGQDGLGLGFQLVDFDVQILLEHPDAYAVVLEDEAQQQMGHADAGMVQTLGLGEGVFNDAADARRQFRFAAGRAFAPPHAAFHRADDVLGLYAQFAQDLDGRTLFHADQPQQEMFGAHVGMVQAQRLLVGQRHDPSRVGTEVLERIVPFRHIAHPAHYGRATKTGAAPSRPLVQSAGVAPQSMEGSNESVPFPGAARRLV